MIRERVYTQSKVALVRCEGDTEYMVSSCECLFEPEASPSAGGTESASSACSDLDA